MTSDVIQAAGYRLAFDYEAPLLRATVTGGHDTSLAVTREYWCRMIDEVHARGATQLLVLDGMQGEVMDDDDLRRFFDALAGKGLEQVRMAYVEGRADQIPRIEYAELMARERGYEVR
ncbi:MAG TPA: hypothetical protein VN205_10900, partial [Thermomonas sp.]|nr:hypothetical protein [Thermomonas sp.]